MSKLNSNKINFNDNDFLVQVEDDLGLKSLSQEELIMNRVQNDAEEEINNAKKEAEKIINNAKLEAQSQFQESVNNAKKEAENILKEAQTEAKDIIEKANIEKNELLTNSKKEIEILSQQSANKGYQDGYDDAQKKFFEENEEKIKAFENFCSNQLEVRDKILKNASRDILNIIENISKNVLLREINSDILSDVIRNTITLFDKKDNITIIVSEKYAKLLYELQKREADIELNFEDFKQYRGFEVVYNKELPEDSIIVENLKERFCASVGEQIDKIIREINNNTQNGNIDIEEYDETSGLEQDN